MLSDVTINLGGRMITMTGADLLLLLVLVFAVSVVIVMAFSRGRRLDAAHTRSADILIVQLERIGDTLDRIASQNKCLLAALQEKEKENGEQADTPVAQRALPLICPVNLKTEPITVELRADMPLQDEPTHSVLALPPIDDSHLSESVRSVLSMLRP
jgi:hypothetical protein